MSKSSTDREEICSFHLEVSVNPGLVCGRLPHMEGLHEEKLDIEKQTQQMSSLLAARAGGAGPFFTAQGIKGIRLPAAFFNILLC